MVITLYRLSFSTPCEPSLSQIVRAWKLVKSFAQCEFYHVLRHLISSADKYTNEGVDLPMRYLRKNGGSTIIHHIP